MSHEWNRWPQKTLDSKPSYPSTVGYLPRWGCDNNTHRCSSIFQGCAMFGVATRRLQICSTIDLWDATVSEKQHIFEGWRFLSGNATLFLLLSRFQLCQNFLRCSDDACEAIFIPVKDECKDAVPRISLDLKSRGLFTVNSAELGACIWCLMFDGLVPLFSTNFLFWIPSNAIRDSQEVSFQGLSLKSWHPSW